MLDGNLDIQLGSCPSRNIESRFNTVKNGALLMFDGIEPLMGLKPNDNWTRNVRIAIVGLIVPEIYTSVVLLSTKLLHRWL